MVLRRFNRKERGKGQARWIGVQSGRKHGGQCVSLNHAAHAEPKVKRHAHRDLMLSSRNFNAYSDSGPVGRQLWKPEPLAGTGADGSKASSQVSAAVSFPPMASSEAATRVITMADLQKPSGVRPK